MGAGSARLPTASRLCGGRDAPAHILQHAGAVDPPGYPEDLIDFLALSVDTADVISPRISVPPILETATELDLPMGETASDCSMDPPPFEKDSRRGRGGRTRMA